MNIYEILSKIQGEFAVKKDQKNSFGNYNYRTAEGILSEVKPLLKKYNVCISLKEEILLLNNRFYIKCIATLFKSKEEFIEVFSNAREVEIKKGMDEAQITGGATSYARKYALCGLLAISEDIDDPDNKNDGKDDPDKKPNPPKEPFKANNNHFENSKSKLLEMPDIDKLEEARGKIEKSTFYKEEEKKELLCIITNKINELSKE